MKVIEFGSDTGNGELIYHNNIVCYECFCFVLNSMIGVGINDNFIWDLPFNLNAKGWGRKTRLDRRVLHVGLVPMIVLL